jgi:hypothetical protein
MDYENEIREVIETKFSHKFCLNVEQALKFKFPNIINLTVEMDNAGIVSVMFEETEYTRKEVETFLAEFRKNGHRL